MSHLFGLHPWDVDRLTVDEWDLYKAWADAWLKARGSG